MSALAPARPAWRLDNRGLGLRIWELGLGGPLPSRPPVVCLHGWLDQGLSFARLAQGRAGRWLAMDQRGFGGSDHAGPGGYPHFADFVGDLDALVEHLAHPVDLVGHSMGGTVAALYAGARPDRVRRLVVLDGLGALAESEPSQLRRMRLFLAGLRRTSRLGRMASVEDAARRLMERHPRLDPEHARLLAVEGTTRDPGSGQVRWSFDPLHVVKGAYPFQEELFGEFLEAVEAPVLAVWASPSIYPPELRERRCARLRSCRQVTVEGGHMLPYEAPRAVGDLVEAFLAAP